MRFWDQLKSLDPLDVVMLAEWDRFLVPRSWNERDVLVPSGVVVILLVKSNSGSGVWETRSCSARQFIHALGFWLSGRDGEAAYRAFCVIPAVVNPDKNAATDIPAPFNISDCFLEDLAPCQNAPYYQEPRKIILELKARGRRKRSEVFSGKSTPVKPVNWRRLTNSNSSFQAASWYHIPRPPG